MGRTEHLEDCGCSNLFGLLQITKTIIPMPIKKSKANLEEDLLAGGTEDCGCPRLDGYKVQIPAPIKKLIKRKANLDEDLLARGTDVGRTEHHEDRG